jgi:hypothetical protein
VLATLYCVTGKDSSHIPGEERVLLRIQQAVSFSNAIEAFKPYKINNTSIGPRSHDRNTDILTGIKSFSELMAFIIIHDLSQFYRPQQKCLVCHCFSVEIEDISLDSRTLAWSPHVAWFLRTGIRDTSTDNTQASRLMSSVHIFTGPFLFKFYYYAQM